MQSQSQTSFAQLPIDPLIVDIPGFPNYQISEDGVIYSKLTGKEMKQRIQDGYNSLKLYNDTVRSGTLFVHALLAQSFIPNPLKKPMVDHIDRDRSNNSLSNLRWVTNSENQYNKGFQKNNKTGAVGVFKSKTESGFCWAGCIYSNNKKRQRKRFPYTDDGFNQAVEWYRQKKAELHTFT